LPYAVRQVHLGNESIHRRMDSAINLVQPPAATRTSRVSVVSSSPRQLCSCSSRSSPLTDVSVSSQAATISTSGLTHPTLYTNSQTTDPYQQDQPAPHDMPNCTYKRVK